MSINGFLIIHEDKKYEENFLQMSPFHNINEEDIDKFECVSWLKYPNQLKNVKVLLSEGCITPDIDYPICQTYLDELIILYKSALGKSFAKELICSINHTNTK